MSDAVKPRAWRFVADLGSLAREAQQLANHYSALLRRLADVDLKPEKETPTLFKWGGKRVYMKNFTGDVPGLLSDPLLTGVEAVVLVLGWVLAGTDKLHPTSTAADTLNAFLQSNGQLSLINAGSSFDSYDLTIFYTRRAA